MLLDNWPLLAEEVEEAPPGGGGGGVVGTLPPPPAPHPRPVEFIEARGRTKLVIKHRIERPVVIASGESKVSLRPRITKARVKHPDEEAIVALIVTSLLDD